MPTVIIYVTPVDVSKWPRDPRFEIMLRFARAGYPSATLKAKKKKKKERKKEKRKDLDPRLCALAPRHASALGSR